MSDTEFPLAFMGGAPANGNALKLWRVAQGWTQGEAAAWYGVHERTWRRYESRQMLIPHKLNLRLQEYNRLKLYENNNQNGETPHEQEAPATADS